MKIIGLAGAAGAGKTTLAHSLREAYEDKVPISVKSFATPLKTMVRSLAFSLGHVRPLDKNAELFNGITVRRALQTLGTDWARQLFGPDVWVACMGAEIMLTRRLVDGDPDDLIVVIDDVRFPNEVKWIQVVGGVVVALTRDGAVSDAPAHASEQFDTISKMPGVVPFHMDEGRSQEAQLNDFIDLIKERKTWL